MQSSILDRFLPLKHVAGRVYRFFREWLAIPRDYAVDLWLYMHYSASFWPARSQQALQGLIMRLYHGVEVGLSYENPRPAFGRKVVNDLLDYLIVYVTKYGADRSTHIAVHVLEQYFELNHSLGMNLPASERKLADVLSLCGDEKEPAGGVLILQREEVLRDARIDFQRFVSSRHSFRRYDAKPVPLETVHQAVHMAMQSPSACNRQPVRVHLLDDPQVRNRVLTVQNGNRGWRDQPDRILLVSTDQRFYKESRERNAAYIDGGLFAMSLIYALHSLGIGTCCLNLNVTGHAAKKIRKAVGLSNAHALILLIAAGQLPETMQVAASVRRDLDEVVKVI